MSSQTARPPRRPDNQRPARSARTKQRYVKQTAHVEARRDGKPIIFGWGGHLSRSEKQHLQTRAVWISSVLVAILIVAVVVISWLNINVITPGLPITSVNGHQIPQSTYRKLVALKAQIEYNKIYGLNGYSAQGDAFNNQVNASQKVIDNLTAQIAATNKKLQALPPGNSIDRTNLSVQLDTQKKQLADVQQQHDAAAAKYQDMQNTVNNELQLYTQPQIGNDSATWLQDDEVIREWLANQSTSIQGQIEPSTSAVNKALQSFIANFSKSKSYNSFLSADNVSDSDIRAMMTLVVRRQNMDNYLQSQVKSPQYAVLARTMTLSTPADANSVLKQLKSGGDFAKLAKSKSVDANTKDKGGTLGWLVRGQYAQTESANVSAVVDNWLFNPTRKLNELSPVLSENGTYRIVQVLNVNPQYTLDDATITSLKSNALTAWLLEQKALPGVSITAVDQNKLLDASNMPSSLPSSAPSQTQPGTGQPGGTGLPSSGGATTP